MVFGVNSNDDIFYRAGITKSTPTGTNWVKVAGKLSQIDSEGNKVWGVNSASNAFTLDIERQNIVPGICDTEYGTIFQWK